MIVLSDQRENRSGQVTLKGKTRDDPFVDRLVAGKQDAHSDLEPGTLGPWRGDRAGKLRCLKRILKRGSK